MKKSKVNYRQSVDKEFKPGFFLKWIMQGIQQRALVCDGETGEIHSASLNCMRVVIEKD